ncbi:hypothetical protein ABPG72_011172 [Tetrahymena utriculariae]
MPYIKEFLEYFFHVSNYNISKINCIQIVNITSSQLMNRFETIQLNKQTATSSPFSSGQAINKTTNKQIPLDPQNSYDVSKEFINLSHQLNISLLGGPVAFQCQKISSYCHPFNIENIADSIDLFFNEKGLEDLLNIL